MSRRLGALEQLAQHDALVGGVDAVVGQPDPDEHHGGLKHVGEVDMFYYYVMPLADDARGASLSDAPELYVALTLKRDLEDRAGPASLDELLTIARNLLKALEHLHSNGVRHCDVKLENVMRFERIWRLGDIGLARRDGEFGSSRGTMAYWPPEGPRELSSDLYALGKTLLLYAAGGPLHQSSGELLKCLIVPGDERRVARLKEILGRACHLDPRQRYQFANEMLRDVERVGPRAARRRIQVALAGLGLVLFAILWTVFHREQPRKLLRLEADRSGQAKDNEATVLAKSRSSPEPDWARPPNELLEERNAELGKRIVDLRHEGRWTEAAAVVREMANLLDKFSLGKHVNNEMTRDTLKQMETIAALPRVDQEEMRQVEHLVDKVTALRADNKNEEALREEYHVYEIRHRILGDNFVEVAAGLIHIGYIQGLLDQKSEAVDSIGKAVRILEKVLTKDHDEIAKCYHNLGFHKFELGRIPEAEVLFRKALDIRVRILGKHFFTAITYSCLVHLYVERFAKARESDRSGWRIKAVECLGGLKEIAQEYEHRAMQFEVLLPMADEKRAKYFRDQIQTYQSDSIQMKAWIDSLEKKHGPNLSNPSLER